MKKNYAHNQKTNFYQLFVTKNPAECFKHLFIYFSKITRDLKVGDLALVQELKSVRSKGFVILL